MPIDYRQIYVQIREIGAGAKERKKALEERRALARNLLAAFSSELDVLKSKVDSAKAVDPSIRCAVPLKEPLASRRPTVGSVSNATLIAADGSQINPDRRAAVQFGLVNVGAIVMRLDSGEAPLVFTETELLFGDALTLNGNPISEGMVALKRDLAERRKLDELSQGYSGQVVTFTDGPIELWGAQGEDSTAFYEFLEKYKNALSRLQSRGVITAGYVDKPSADLVARLLEVAYADAEQTRALREFHPLCGVSDRWLFGERENPLLPPGERSAVFKIQSSSEKNYQGALEVHFFYLNVGVEGRPWPVRVEIPRWVADDPAQLDLLHAALVNQCRMMGSRPYPYLLHRAHETAIVKMEEKRQIEQLLALELRRHNEEVDEGSYKQSAKDLQGRTRV